jgi:hypothetical protein
MGRIRSIKPEFFTNIKLYKAEKETGLPIRLSFSGLFTACDRAGRFKWIPEELQLAILPFDRDVDFSRVLDALFTRGYVVKYRVADELFGFIPTWEKHQYINNRESASILPIPSESNILTREPRVNHAPLVCTWGREGEGKGKGRGKEEIINNENFQLENQKSENEFLVINETDFSEKKQEPEINEKIVPVVEEKKEKTSAQKEKNKSVLDLAYSPCQKTFQDYYQDRKRKIYVWSAKDGGQLKLLIGKLISLLRQTGIEPTVEKINTSLAHLLEKLPEMRNTWVFENLSVAILSSKFNEITDQIINNNNKINGNSHPTVRSEQAKKDRADHIHDLVTKLGDEGSLQKFE